MPISCQLGYMHYPILHLQLFYPNVKLLHSSTDFVCKCGINLVAALQRLVPFLLPPFPITSANCGLGRLRFVFFAHPNQTATTYFSDSGGLFRYSKGFLLFLLILECYSCQSSQYISKEINKSMNEFGKTEKNRGETNSSRNEACD